MNDLLIQVLAGIIVVVLSALGGFFVRSKFFQKGFLLPGAQSQLGRQGYSHLNGKWHLYWLSFVSSDASRPVWMHGLQDLRIDGNQVHGVTEFTLHPVLSSQSVLRGEIRAGKMIVLDVNVTDQTEFASIIYPNLRSDKLLVGIWSGLDNLLRPIAAPAVLSREEMTAEDLNKALRHSAMSLIPVGEYEAFQAASE